VVKPSRGAYTSKSREAEMAYLHIDAIKYINCIDITIGDRQLQPTERAIEKMAASLALPQGQLNAIAVYYVAPGMYRLISGATRLRAARKLGWKEIRAEIFIGHPLDYKIMELTENMDREGLAPSQKRAMREKRAEYQRELMASVEPTKLGRGKKGGIREAARQAGISERTARRRQDETKVRHNTQNAALSDAVLPAIPHPVKDLERSPQSVLWTLAERRMVREDATRRGMSFSDVVREIVREHYRIKLVA
jgi:ParB-like chromosome segregation protein Spo0J